MTMYYYAYIDIDTGFCHDVIESEEQLYDPSYVEVSGFATFATYLKYYPIRKTYENGVWRDTTLEEAERILSTTPAERLTIGDEWLDIVVNNKADIDHTHDEYVSSDDLQMLADMIDTKADIGHNHDEYADVNHSHSEYATQIALDELGVEIGGKADINHTHDEYALSSHEHDYAESGHNHDSSYAPISHSHTNYATTSALNELSSVVSGKADSSHNHTGVYDVNGAAANALLSAQTYTDEAIEGLASKSYVLEKVDAITVESIGALPNTTIIPTVPTNVSAFVNDAGYLTEHQSLNGFATETYVDAQISAIDIPSTLSDLTTDSTHRVVTDAEKSSWNAKSNFSGNYNDLTNKPSIPSISGLATEIYVDEAVSTKANNGHTHDNRYYTETEVDTLLEGKANTSHTHTIANITNLQSTLDGKAATSHGTHVSYSTTAPVMDGTASVGTASTVARSDHKHPTDTSRAAQTSLDSHTGNKSNPHGVTLGQLGLTATASEINVLDGITATVTELNYVDGVTSNIQTQLNGKSASGHTHSYAGSSSVGGAATSANKLNTDAGNLNTPVYFSNGIPVACTSLDLDTTGNAATATNVAWSGVTSKPSYYDAKAIKSITRNGTTFTYTRMDGTTDTFTQQDNNTTYSVATTSANGLMSSSDKSKLDGMVMATVSEVETYLGI